MVVYMPAVYISEYKDKLRVVQGMDAISPQIINSIYE